jgi:uncharacterized RDD family membrane protein YckC
MQQFDFQQKDLLADEVFYERASTGKRLANYIIDMIVFYLIMIVVGILVAAVWPNTFDAFVNDSSGFNLLDRLFSLLLYGLFMSVVEAVLKGRSVGKLITKTRAVNLDGSPITAGTAFSRGFSRAVPFCVFSAFGDPCNPWQDKWTATMVVNDVKK